MNFLFVALLSSGLAVEPALPDAETVFAIPDPLRIELHRVVPARASDENKLRNLVDFVFGDAGLDLSYDTSTTRTVAETYRDRAGNCVSVTLLFVALAREVGLQAQPQEFEQILTWQLHESVLYSVGHVNTRVRTSRSLYVVDIDGSPKLARNEPEPISDERLLAHFYGNRGAELMLAGRHAEADSHLRAALALQPDFVPAWNNLGVLRMRESDIDAAIAAFHSAHDIAKQNISTLLNLIALHGRSGNTREQSKWQRRLERVRRNDPFYHYLLALEAEQHQDYTGAGEHFRRAIRLREGEHLFHFGLARAAYHNGQLEEAARALARAHTLSAGAQRNLYQAKLESLSH
ncbi:MAG TPA: tetratricopeptide repeat protein [Arenimonas sp.]|nr:tetratricopeptide repeat protein [Arenimonas sp.]